MPVPHVFRASLDGASRAFQCAGEGVDMYVRVLSLGVASCRGAACEIDGRCYKVCRWDTPSKRKGQMVIRAWCGVYLD